jgi:RNA polymerase sigma-70 factor (ECF subfamily)
MPSGDARETAFLATYDDHVWDVYGYFGYRTGSREIAEDLTQTTFEKALRAWGRFDPERASPRTWLLSIAHNVLVDHYRAEASNRREALTEDVAHEAGYVEDAGAPLSLGLSPDLAAALEELGERDRQLIALRFGGDLSGPEIAELTGLSLANVQQILSRSLRRMRARLGQPELRRTTSG